ncbi:CBL-interacting serine/threonine-protein kinase 4-like [Citrus sinensis]|uniref:CBL-interacting serine/threonine-protein kinase 4-like n=1 Tax=Citrus sinensis TaxID=2711 RepID=UPI002279AEFF|nr:CBL-interacting serine/threonine-protein kinase 4-like [Citrus sinensis]
MAPRATVHGLLHLQPATGHGLLPLQPATSNCSWPVQAAFHDRHENLKVSDFGLSALPEQIKNGMLHMACGTPSYTAPEVVARRGYDGAVADAWSCGVILFVLLAGYLSFDDSNLLAMYKKINRRDYQFPSFVSKPARSLIYQLLDPNPKTRMSIEKIMNISWFQKSLQRQRKTGQGSSLFH